MTRNPKLLFEDMTIGARLKWLRGESGLSVRAAAKAMDVTHGHLSNVERGNEAAGATNPTLNFLLRACEVYGAPIHDLVKGLGK